ncbi:MAG: hypothetical protein HY878_00845 [Deltaproteobacteria bacterium]|nr:hypothetical protein [Deltaproteobacteria bacterium]
MGVITVIKPSTNVIVLGKDVSGRTMVSFSYDPQLVEKVKTIKGRRWHKDGKYWSLPDSDGIIEEILKVFKGEEIHLDPALQLPKPVIAKGKTKKQSQKYNNPSIPPVVKHTPKIPP